MFDLDNAVLEWRERQQRESSLSPRELDELEDHLRAHVDLELELSAVLAPAQAFAIARRELGASAALSEEFAKAGKPRWRRWLVSGWAMYVAAAFLPVIVVFGSAIYGHEMLRDIMLDIRDEWPLTLVNLAMIMTVPALWGARLACNRWLRRLLGTVGVCSTAAVAYATVHVLATGGLTDLAGHGFFAGWWAWGASYICVANALRLRAKQWAPAKLKRMMTAWLPWPRTRATAGTHV